MLSFPRLLLFTEYFAGIDHKAARYFPGLPIQTDRRQKESHFPSLSAWCLNRKGRINGSHGSSGRIAHLHQGFRCQQGMICPKKEHFPAFICQVFQSQADGCTLVIRSHCVQKNNAHLSQLFLKFLVFGTSDHRSHGNASLFQRCNHALGNIDLTARGLQLLHILHQSELHRFPLWSLPI